MNTEELELVIKATSKAIIEKHGEFHPNVLHPGIWEMNFKDDPKVYYVYEELAELYYGIKVLIKTGE